MVFQDGRLIFDFKGARLSLSCAGADSWRIQSLRGGVYDDLGAAQILSRDLGEERAFLRFPAEAEENGGVIKVTSPGSGSSVVISDDEIDIIYGGRHAAEITDIFDDGSRSGADLRLADGERVYGCGERLNRVNQRGKVVDIMAIDRWLETEGNSYVPVPFVMTSRCAGLLFNRYERSVFDIGSSDEGVLSVAQNDAPVDLYIFAGGSPEKILTAYSKITGFAPEPAQWLYGTQVCRYYPDFSTPEGVYEMDGKMAENGFPWDAVILEGWDTYDAGRFDSLKELTSRLHDMGKKVLLYSPCGKLTKKLSALGMKDGYILQNKATGERVLPETNSYNPADNPDGRTASYLDITSAEARKWWFGDVWGRLVNDIGIDGCKIDFCEQFPEFVPVAFADGRETAGAHHWYPTLFSAMMFRLFNSKKDGGMCFARGGGIGAQRYPFLWAGDQLREFRYLRSVISAVLSSGLSGIPFMSYDMAAYRPAKNGDDEDRVFLRGLEFTAFSANIQTHGVVTRPYDFGEHVKDCYREYSLLHEALKPYIAEQGRISCSTGLPLMRHLFIYDCGDENVYDIEDEYMFGSSLLVCPVLDGGCARDIYLPRGEWKNIFTGDIVHGRTWLKDYRVPPEMIPVFRLEDADSDVLDKCLADGEKHTGRIRSLAGMI